MITDFKLIDCNSSNYITLKRATYNQNGKAKIWDLTIVHDSVAILIFDKSTSEVVLVKQFRPPVYLRNSDGFTYELCAGILDKDKSEEQSAIEEIEEECGYRVSLKILCKKLPLFIHQLDLLEVSRHYFLSKLITL